MSDKRIDQLTDSITSSADLDGSELLLVSDPDASQASGFKSKKVSLNTVKDFITPHCGPVFYDMSDAAADEYRWKIGKDVSTGGGPSWKTGDVMFDHTFTRDVLLLAAGYISNPMSTYDEYTKFFIDDGLINLVSFGFSNTSIAHLFVKKGQHVKWINNYPGGHFTVTSIPIVGGGIFIDTSDTSKFVYNKTLSRDESISFGFDAIVNMYTDPLSNNGVQGAYWDGIAYGSPDFAHSMLGGKKVFCLGGLQTGYNRFYLKAGQPLIAATGTITSTIYGYISAYPILY